jgi:hypothetical protein
MCVEQTGVPSAPPFSGLIGGRFVAVISLQAGPQFVGAHRAPPRLAREHPCALDGVETGR